MTDHRIKGRALLRVPVASSLPDWVTFDAVWWADPGTGPENVVDGSAIGWYLAVQHPDGSYSVDIDMILVVTADTVIPDGPWGVEIPMEISNLPTNSGVGVIWMTDWSESDNATGVIWVTDQNYLIYLFDGSPITSTSPWVWAENDELHFVARYHSRPSVGG